MQKSRTLSLIFIAAIVLAAAGIIFFTVSSIDSLHANDQQLRKFVAALPVKFDSSNVDSETSKFINSKVQEAAENQKEKTDLEKRPLAGSEIVFVQALQAGDRSDYKTSAQQFTQILTMIPVEAKTVKIWKAAGTTPADRDLYTAFVYQQRGFAYLQLKYYKLAVDDLSAAIKLRPSYSLNYRNRAQAYEILGEKALAAADRKKAILAERGSH